MNVTRLQDSVKAEHPSARDLFSAEMTKEVDSSVWVDLEHAVTPWVKMKRINNFFHTDPCHGIGKR